MSALSARVDRERVSSWLTWRKWPVFLVAGLIAFALAYVLFITTVEPFSGGNWRTTTFGSAVHDPSSFLKIVLDSLTFASALFIVASGFALIFGLMRTVNMAHGAFYLLAGYIAYEVQQGMTGQGFSLELERGQHVGVARPASGRGAVHHGRRAASSSRPSCAGHRARSSARR